MYIFSLGTLSIQISKAKLLVEMASESGRFCEFWRKKIFSEIIDNKDSKQKYLWGLVKQIHHGLFLEVVKITSPSVLDAWGYFPPSCREVASCIQHLGTSNFYYFPQYHVVFV